MASEERIVQYIAEQTGLGSLLSWRKMFGEYALYLDGKVVALVCDNHLFVKPTPAGRAWLPDAREASPYPGAKPHLLLEDEVEDRERLARLLLATAQELPPPKPKRVRAKKTPTSKT